MVNQMTTAFQDLTNTLLIAMPQMDDPNFARTVIYICEHDYEGAMGLVINRPLDICVGKLFGKIGMSMSEQARHYNEQVFYGGPLSIEHGFLLHSGHDLPGSDMSLPVTPDITLSSSIDMLESVANGEGPDSMLMVLGYAGWGAGQLEQELANNYWLTCPADPSMFRE